MEEGASQVFPFPELTFSCRAGSVQSVDLCLVAHCEAVAGDLIQDSSPVNACMCASMWILIA